MSDIKIPESALIASMKRFLDECDYDELARLAGEMYGGTCFLNPYRKGFEEPVFDFSPTSDYFGEFDDFIEVKDCPILEPSDQ